MMVKGADIERLIPQRRPFIMVDSSEVSDGNRAATTLAVRLDNYFALPDGTMSESGLIEHIAQSCSAFGGLQAQEADTPPVGIIGEVKHFTCHRRPFSGERLDTVVTFDMTFGNVRMATGISSVDGEVVAEAKLKIFMQ